MSIGVFHMNQNKKEISTFGDFLQSIDQFFSQSFNNFHHNGLFQPTFPVKTYRTDEHFIIEAELAGVAKEQLQVEIYEHYVRIAVNHYEATIEQNENDLVHFESEQFSQRERIVQLPYGVKSKAGKASFKNGLLTIRFPSEHKKTLEIDDDER